MSGTEDLNSTFNVTVVTEESQKGGSAMEDTTNKTLSLEEIKEKLKGLRRQFLLQETDLLNVIGASKQDEGRFQRTLDSFLEINDQLIKMNGELVAAMEGDEFGDDDVEKECQSINAYRDRGIKAIQSACDYKDKLKPGVSAETSADQDRRMNLPEVSIPKFKSEPRDWLRFWGQFKSIHENPVYDNQRKFFYLLHYMKEGTDAYELVSSLTHSKEFYPEAIEKLTTRYGNEDNLLNTYTTDLLALVINNITAKDKMPLLTLTVKVDSTLRALDTLDLAKVDPKSWIYLLVVAALPLETQEKWHMSEECTRAAVGKDRMQALLNFMGKQVEAKDRMKANDDFKQKLHQSNQTVHQNRKQLEQPMKKKLPTTMGLHVGDKRADTNCVFCDRSNHLSRDCYIAKQRMTLEEKKQKLKAKGRCFICTLPHLARKCTNKDKLKCDNCQGSHYAVLCPTATGKEADGPPAKKRKWEPSPNFTYSKCNKVSKGDVCLQTLQVILKHGETERKARILFDTGSSRSYILKSTAKQLKMKPKTPKPETVFHGLFGGGSEINSHKVYDLHMKGLEGNHETLITVRDQREICKEIDTVDRNLASTLASKGIILNDIRTENNEMQVLIGADLYGQFMTGKMEQVSDSLFAFETIFGWTLIGEMDCTDCSSMSSVTVLINKESQISRLWELDLLGIRDSTEVLNEMEKEKIAKEIFLKSVTRKADGRYCVRLPWKDGHPPLPSNKQKSIMRLKSTSAKLEKAGMLNAYNKLFKEWTQEDFLETVDDDTVPHHYLPHRAVIKPESLTTPVRPVFDASCKASGQPSLNDCLHKGQSFILLIPAVLMRFRERAIGFTSDIRKAFQMIEVHENDRDFLRFLWWKEKEMENLKTYRHKRVPFGATCSPFILGAILEHHINSVKDSYREEADRLWESLYVDNCVSSEHTMKEYLWFREISVDILAEAKMDLRMWLSNKEDLDNPETQSVSVLGLKWNRKDDSLYLDMTDIPYPEVVTKRTVLSTVSKIFDPIGFSSPALLPMKLLLQRQWLSKIKWDAELPALETKEFENWFSQLEFLKEMKIPRIVSNGVIDKAQWQLHTMADGSKHGYAAVCFIRTVNCDGEVSVQLIAAKSRVAPTKELTIPRIELLGCLIAARLATEVKTALKLTNISEHYWTDSATALAWIMRNDQWGTYVGNRTGEITRLTNPKDWKHLPGKQNPADLPSRGCFPQELYSLKWTEGPEWLKESKKDWPQSAVNYNENEIEIERKRKVQVVTTCSNVEYDNERPKTFRTLVRIHGWVRRFANNCRSRNKKCGPLVRAELELAEADILRKIQSDFFRGEEPSKVLPTLETFNDNGLIRVKTRLGNLDDEWSFRYPAVLPGKHPLVKQLIKETHKAYRHAGHGFVMIALRRKYWILKARQNIKKVIFRCNVCRRYAAKGTVTETAPLSLDRIKSAEVFEVVGIDLAGPFTVKTGRKVWIVLYTCAVYRAIHLQLVSSLSTGAFIRSLQKFVEKFRRPDIIYSDNGTNFKGAYNLFKRLDWKTIQEKEAIKEIEWRFNPPTAAWWGGWWERLVRTIKDLLRKEIRTAILTATELAEVVITVQDVMNDRPLTYVSENIEDLEPLTPSLFLYPLGNVSFPEAKYIDGGELRSRYKYLQMVKRDLKIRFRKEYVSLLISRNPKKATRPLKVGELVLVGQDNKKRSEWALGRILELFPGSDGICRVARVRTAKGVMTRPVQRLYALEADEESSEPATGEVRTRAGRLVKLTRK